MSSRSRTQVFVITGASQGIGAAVARRLAMGGYKLVLAARDSAALEAVVADCDRLGARAVAVPTDVSIEEECRRLIDRAIEAFGRIDVLINNAGVSMHAPFDDITDWATFDRLWRVNCLGTIFCTRFAWPYLKPIPGKPAGQVVGINSLAGRFGVPARTTYCASKFAQAGFLEALRIEAADHGIAVTVIYPGVVATEIRRHGLRGDGQPAGASGLDEANAMPVDVCARKIVKAVLRRRRELVMTSKGRFGLWLKLIAPRRVDNLARRALRKEPP